MARFCTFFLLLFGFAGIIQAQSSADEKKVSLILGGQYYRQTLGGSYGVRLGMQIKRIQICVTGETDNAAEGFGAQFRYYFSPSHKRIMPFAGVNGYFVRNRRFEPPDTAYNSLLGVCAGLRIKVWKGFSLDFSTGFGAESSIDNSGVPLYGPWVSLAGYHQIGFQYNFPIGNGTYTREYVRNWEENYLKCFSLAFYYRLHAGYFVPGVNRQFFSVNLEYRWKPELAPFIRGDFYLDIAKRSDTLVQQSGFPSLGIGFRYYPFPESRFQYFPEISGMAFTTRNSLGQAGFGMGYKIGNFFSYFINPRWNIEAGIQYSNYTSMYPNPYWVSSNLYEINAGVRLWLSKPEARE